MYITCVGKAIRSKLSDTSNIMIRTSSYCTRRMYVRIYCNACFPNPRGLSANRCELLHQKANCRSRTKSWNTAAFCFFLPFLLRCVSDLERSRCQL